MSGKMWNEQNEYLDEMGVIVQKLGQQINNINAEVNTQTKKASDIDLKLEKTQENMNSVNGQLENLKDAIGSTMWCNLIQLSLMLVLLLAVIFLL